METKNKRLLDIEANKEYYAKSDGNWIDPNYCTKAHLVLDRIAWARKWVHEVGSKFHLDIGCKDGYLGMTLASEGLECICVDPSADAIDEAQLRAKERDLDVTYYVGYIEDLQAKHVFDTVTMLEVLEHVIDPDLVVEKLSKLGRYVLITTPDANGRHGMEDSEQNEEHVRMYTKEELKELVSKYGEIIELAERDDQLCVIFQSNGN